VKLGTCDGGLNLERCHVLWLLFMVILLGGQSCTKLI
jgi:hypothetical protein